MITVQNARVSQGRNVPTANKARNASMAPVRANRMGFL